jgi:transcriptional regulator with XRE-family HTH domain
VFEMTDEYNFGSRVRQLRDAMPGQPNQEVMAKAIGVARSTLAGIESAANAPGRKTLIAIADYFGVTIDYLIRGGPPPGAESAADDAQQSEIVELVEVWRLLNAQQRRMVLSMIDVMLASGDSLDA